MMMIMMTNMRVASQMCATLFGGVRGKSLELKDFPNGTEKSSELGEIKVQFTAKTHKVKLL